MTKDMRKENSQKRNKLPFIIMLILMILVLGVVLFLSFRGKETGEDVGVDDTQYAEENLEKWQEGIISYGGKDYQYNRDIKTYLIMGVDKDGVVEEVTDYTKGGQSDAMFLLVTDASAKKMSIISIHRNTMTRIETCDKDGKILGYKKAQICIQHGYGDGANLSCVRAADAISYLFYNIPVNGYLAMNMDGMPIMNDAIGGVEVTVLTDLSNNAKGVSLKKGETVTLTGDEAYVYLRSRDVEEFDSASDRLMRQEQYIKAYMTKLETIASQNPAAAVSIYEDLEDYMVSSIDFAGLVSEVQAYSFDPEADMYSLPGETIMGNVYEEYYLNEEAFYEMVLDIFYHEVTE